MSLAIRTGPSLARRIAPLTAGHASVDFTQGALPVLLPYLIDKFDLSYAQAAALVLALTVSSSVTQPVFGRLSDRFEAPWLLPASVLTSGLGLVGCALAPSYAASMVAIFVSGIGVAAYHPAASRLASQISGDQRGTGMSLFSVGGNLGFALGPIYGGIVAGVFGLAGGWLLMVPALVGAGFLTNGLGNVARAARAGSSIVRSGVDQWGAMIKLLFGLCLRGYVNFGMLAFIPLYEEEINGHSRSYGAVILAALLAGGALFTLAAGPVADAIGPRRTMVLLSIPVAPLVWLYTVTPSLLGSAAIVLAGALVIGTFSVSIVLSQNYLPTQAALAAGLSIGLSIGIGGAFSIVIGVLADAYGLETAMLSVAAVAVAVVGVLFLLPRDEMETITSS